MSKNAAQHREDMQELVRAAQEEAFAVWVEKVHSDEATIDDLRKFNEFAAKVTGLEAEKKQDPNAGLAVFNIVFQNGGFTATQVAAEPAPEQIAADIPAVEAWPFRDVVKDAPVEAAPAAREETVDDLMAGLDNMLGRAD